MEPVWWRSREWKWYWTGRVRPGMEMVLDGQSEAGHELWIPVEPTLLHIPCRHVSLPTTCRSVALLVCDEQRSSLDESVSDRATVTH